VIREKGLVTCKIDFEGGGDKEKGGTQWETKARRIRTRAGNRR